MKYPFNKIGWQDFVYKFFRVPRYKRMLWKSYKKITETGDFAMWDMCNSSVDLLFANFELFYSNYKDKFYPVEKIMKWYREDEGFMSCTGAEEMIKERQDAYITMAQAYQYITVSRKKNISTMDLITDEMFAKSVIGFEEIQEGDDKGMFEMVDKIPPKYFLIEHGFDENGLLEITKKEETTRALCNSLYLDEAIQDKDTEFAIRILNIRGYLWD